MEKNTRTNLERAEYPEQVGVSSARIADFIDDLNRSGIETHSLMFLRNGKVAFERWAEPFGPDIPHTMYSVSKSVTATALGFAIDEGYLTLETRVLDVFPEFTPPKRDEYLEKLNVWHLITMTAGKDVLTLSDKTKNRWMEDFFEAKWAFEPGTFWRYISENTFMVSAMIQRLTGQTMSEFLTPRFYEPLGFDRVPFWEKDGYGIDAGGWGIFLTTEELMKMTLCWLQGGVFEGKQVIPADWAREAVKKQVENLQYSELASTVGYGYGFWRNPVPGSYRADGLFSQFGMVFEKENACFVMTASEIFEEKARDCVWRHFPGIFTEAGGRNNDPEVQSRLRLKAMPDLPAAPRSRFEKKIENKVLNINKNPVLEQVGMPVGMLAAPALLMSPEKRTSIEEVRFRFRENECEMTWRENHYKNTVTCGMDGKPRFGELRIGQLRFHTAATASWENEKTLCVWVRALEAVGERRLKFVIEGEKVTMIPGGYPDGKTTMEYISGFVPYFVSDYRLVKAARAVLSKADRVVEPKHHGKVRRAGPR